jgi:hypothetical protein
VASKGTKVGMFDVSAFASELRLDEICTTFRVDLIALLLYLTPANKPIDKVEVVFQSDSFLSSNKGRPMKPSVRTNVGGKAMFCRESQVLCCGWLVGC